MGRVKSVVGVRRYVDDIYYKHQRRTWGVFCVSMVGYSYRLKQMSSKRKSPRVSLAAQLIAHVEVCDERYKSIETQQVVMDSRLGRIEKIMLSVAGATFTTLLAAIWFLLSHGKFA